MIGPGTFLRPRTLAELCDVLAKHAGGPSTATLLAGGTDLVVDAHLAPPQPAAPPPRVVVDVSSLTELALVEDRGDVIRLGGGVTYRTLRLDPLLSRRLPILALMSKDVGAVQIQARGTLAGNIATASPAADGVAALAALDAVVGLRSVRGERSVPLDAYFTGYRKTVRAPDEVIAWIDVRVPSAGARWTWRKVGTRLAQAISKVALAAVAEIDHGVVARARFGMASVGPTTAFLASVRAEVEGKSTRGIDPARVDAALARDISPIDDVRSTGAYRMHVARVLVRGFLVGERAAVRGG